MLSPLRYPGGKSDFSATALAIVRALDIPGATFVEPYAGSGIVSLTLLDSGLIARAVLIEKDPLVCALWQAIYSHLDELLARFWDLPITIETWRELRPLLKVLEPTPENVVDLAIACLFYNRANFSGIMAAGPIGGMSQKSQYTIDCRTNKDEITVRLIAAASFAGRVEVRFGDALASLPSLDLRKTIFYFDPPYFLKGESLYRHAYKLADHRRLAEVVSRIKAPWFLSYDVHHVIEFLYESHYVNKLNFRYSAGGARSHEELLISNFAVAPELLGDLIRPARQMHMPGSNRPLKLAELSAVGVAT